MDRHVLKGQAILLVEEQEQPDTARNLESALERFGTEVVPPQRAVEAIERLEEFDFSLASLDWSPDSSEHSAVARRLKEGGARFLFCPKQLPEEVPTRRGASSSQRPPHPRRSSNPPRSLPTRRNRSKRCAWGMARIRQEPRSTGQALRSSRGSRICWHTSIRYDRSDEGHDWTDAGPFRTWKSDKMHVGVPFAHLGCSPFGCVVQWGDTRARNLPELQAHARGKWGSATRGAKD